MSASPTWTPAAEWLADLIIGRGLYPLAINGVSTRRMIEARAASRGMQRVTALTVYRALGLDGKK